MFYLGLLMEIIFWGFGNLSTGSILTGLYFGDRSILGLAESKSLFILLWTLGF